MTRIVSAQSELKKPYNSVMANIERLYRYHSPEDVILLLARASALAKERPELKWSDIQTEFKVGYEQAILIFDWLTDANAAQPFISKHWIRAGRAYVRNNPFPTLVEMTRLLKVGERRAFMIMQALEKRGLIRITKDFSFERVGRMASFADLVRQMKPLAKKHQGRCEPPILIKFLFVDPVTALRLAQYGEENLGLRWKSRQRELL